MNLVQDIKREPFSFYIEYRTDDERFRVILIKMKTMDDYFIQKTVYVRKDGKKTVISNNKTPLTARYLEYYLYGKCFNMTYKRYKQKGMFEFGECPKCKLVSKLYDNIYSDNRYCINCFE